MKKSELKLYQTFINQNNHYGKQYPLTPDECYPGNYKLLLL